MSNWDTVWMNAQTFPSVEAREYAEDNNIDINTNIQAIIQEYSEYEFFYFDKEVSGCMATMGIYFKNNIFLRARYNINNLENKSVLEKEDIYKYFVQEISKIYGMPYENSDDSGPFVNSKWYFNNMDIAIEIYMPEKGVFSSRRGGYIWLTYNYKSTEIMKNNNSGL
jgi:hypothetical protein